MNINPILSRTIAAIIGGYLLANLLAILLSYLSPSSQANGVMTGMLFSYLIYACAVLWVFYAKTARSAWLGLLVPSVVSALGVYVLTPSGLF